MAKYELSVFSGLSFGVVNAAHGIVTFDVYRGDIVFYWPL